MGQWRPSPHGNLGDRVAASKQPRSSVPLPTHVTVTIDGRTHPGILFGWVNTETGPAGRVVWVSREANVHIEVLDRSLIDPVR